jgi:hypothetical protein
VSVVSNDKGMKLVVDGKDFTWYFTTELGLLSVGTNYTYSLWNQSDDVIKAALIQKWAC